MPKSEDKKGTHELGRDGGDDGLERLTLLVKVLGGGARAELLEPVLRLLDLVVDGPATASQ